MQIHETGHADAFASAGTSPPPDPDAVDLNLNVTPAGHAALDRPRRPRRSRQPDLLVSDHGTIWFLRPVSPLGQRWVDEYLPGDRREWSGATVIEHRFVFDIVRGAERDGLDVALGGGA